MIHDFGIVWSERALLLSGLANTTILSTLSAAAALVLGFVLTPALMSKQRLVSSMARGRGAWAAQPREPIEAGVAFGFPEIRLFRRIILPPLLLSAGPVIGNQMIQIIKDSAFLTIIALPELTHAASSIQSRHYVPFAAFITAVFLYWGLCLVIEAGVSSIGRVAEARR